MHGRALSLIDTIYLPASSSEPVAQIVSNGLRDDFAEVATGRRSGFRLFARSIELVERGVPHRKRLANVVNHPEKLAILSPWAKTMEDSVAMRIEKEGKWNALVVVRASKNYAYTRRKRGKEREREMRLRWRKAREWTI